MTDKQTPTDAEILDAAEDFRSQYTHGGTTFDEFDEIGFTRAVLAKWGQPAQQAPAGAADVNYHLIDRFLRINLYDDDYAEYSAALDALASTPAPAEQPVMPTDPHADARARWQPGQQWLCRLRGTDEWSDLPKTEMPMWLPHVEYRRHPDCRHGVTSPAQSVAEIALKRVLKAVQAYLPPDGPSAHDTMTEIIEIVDPWPLIGASHGQAPAETGNSVSAQADSVQEDAARYRWLRDRAHPDSEDSGIAVSESDFNDWGNKFTRYYSGEELDAAIDAARAAQKKEE